MTDCASETNATSVKDENISAASTTPCDSLKSPTKQGTNEALQHLVQGKRHLLVKDVNSAVDSLQEACKLFAEQYGETADQCGEAYFVYGKALLELARAETGVLGQVGDAESDEDGNDNDEEVESEDKDEAKVNGSSNAENEKPVDENGCESEDKDEPKVNGSSNGEDEKVADENGCESEDKVEDTATECVDPKDDDAGEVEEAEETQDLDATETNENKEDEDEDESVSNIQLAWEVLELAKVIFERQPDDKETALKLAQVYLKLGEVSIESENYTQAVTDLKQCLSIQQRHLASDDRLIAETHYHQGIAHSLANEFSSAVECFDRAVATIRARINSLNDRIALRDQKKDNEDEAADGTTSDNPFYREEDEVGELRSLLPDIEEKIADMRQMKLEAQRKLAAMFTDGAGPSSLSDGPQAPVSPVKAIMRPQASAQSTNGGSSQADRPTNSISHLVRRKRPTDDQDPGAAKKVKFENGHAD